jgi:nucleoside-diphosphate-sugar epimerase
MKKICVTGAYGFIGKSVCETLVSNDKTVIGLVRNLELSKNSNKITYLPIDDIGFKTNLKDSLADTDCVIHCAGKTPNTNNTETDQIKVYHTVNVEGTKQIAEQAIDAGVKRLIFLSSIKVNGENTYDNCGVTGKKHHIKKIFTHNSLPSPKDHYAISKLEAEKTLWEISSRTGLEVVIVRLPLVYGNGVKGNLASLTKLVRTGIPFPLSIVKNQRSMIGIDNLISLLIRCIDHPEASGKTFLASDGEDLSVPELINLIASSIGRKASLFPLPIFMLKFLGSVFGKKEEINRLVGSLRIDNSYTKKTLDWTPPISVEEGIRRMVQGK